MVLIIFTFHYGSITMNNAQAIVLIANTFTFHYGSITIEYMILFKSGLSTFTFHYGSITILMLIITNKCKLIYIPLWFNYYDDVGFVYKIHCIFTFHYGSITILNQFLLVIISYLFTFHYGSITITPRPPTPVCSFQFTFHYGSITILSICILLYYSLYLHSIMVQLLLNDAIDKYTSK